MRETERLGSLLSSSSPVLYTFLPVSVFIRADVRTCPVSSSSLGLAAVTSLSSALLTTARPLHPALLLLTALSCRLLAK